jgi:hypothetical protein
MRWAIRKRERDHWKTWIAENWLAALVIGSTTLLTGAATLRFIIGPYHVNIDSALFQHAGWYVANGATPYVDFWDIKPPLIYAVTTLLAIASGGNMAVLHLLSVTLASGTVIVGVTLVGVLAHRLTGRARSGLVAGAMMFVLPTVYAFPSAGIRPKYFAFAFGVGALVLAVDDRPIASGIAAAVASGFWQLGGLIALLVVAIGLQRGGTRAMGRTVAGGGAVALVVVAPFVAANLTVPLFLETILAPLYTVEQYTIKGRLLEFVFEIGYGLLLLPVGLHGWARGVRVDPSTYWWVGVGGSMYLLQVLLEMQGAIELIFPWTFLAIGVGVSIADLSASWRSRAWVFPALSPSGVSRASFIVGLVVLLAVMNVVWAFGPTAPPRDHIEAAQERHAIADYDTIADRPEDVPSMRTIYWEKRRPESCHYRAGDKQRHFVTRINATVNKSTCGQWPFEEEPRAWLVDQLPLP